MQSPTPSWGRGALIALLPLLSSAPTFAQTYSAAPILRNLARPHGITVLPNGAVYFTELPTPGQNGGQNTVSRFDPGTTAKVVLVLGEPEPTHLAADASGALYWTCKSAGVVQRRQGATQVTFVRNLAKPNGIAASATGTLYLTELPTPGVGGGNGGTNRVSSFLGTTLTTLTMGEPEPTDIAVDVAGNLFWTCKSAGVILRRDATTLAVAPVLTKLEKPSGIAIDGAGSLYFTEVPTPGISGANGGRNKVWRYDPALKNLTLVAFGDPEPTDVAVSQDGSRVYWTCTSAGVIVRADRTAGPLTVRAFTAPKLGTLVPLLFSSAQTPGQPYLAATSFGLGPLTFGERRIALALDELLVASVGGGAPCIFGGYAGTLDAGGHAAGAISLPALSELRGLILNTAFFVLESPPTLGVAAASSTLRFTIE